MLFKMAWRLCNLSLYLVSILLPDAAGLHRQRSLPHRPPVIPLVARMADQNTSGTPAMTEREASRLDKFKQLLAGPNTDLGKRYCASSLHLSGRGCVTRPLVALLNIPLFLTNCLASSFSLPFKALSLPYFLALLCFSLCLPAVLSC